MRRISIALFVCLGVWGQSKLEFEVVSIRPHPGDVNVSSNMIKGAAYRGVAITLAGVIQDAYDLKCGQVSGGPGWVTSERFDIDAKADGETELTWDRARPMLQAMLADRFKLKVRREMKDVVAYDLVIAKGGPKFKENTDPDVKHPGFSMYVNGDGAHFKATKGQLSGLILQLPFYAGRPVVDKTGLAGGYDLKLDWAPDNSPDALNGSVATLFTALQEQLGLKLEPSRTTQEMLTIESAEKPSGN
jgi:bla regulator protein BlaR1